MIRLIKLYFYTTCFFIVGSFIFSSIEDVKFISIQAIIIILLGPIMLITSYSYYYLIKLKFSRFSVTELKYEKHFKLNLSIPLKICFLLSILYFFLFINYNADINDILSIPRQIAYRRYTDDLVTPLILKILRIFLTTGTIFAAFELYRSSSLLSKLYLVLILFDGLMSAGKAGPLIGLLFYFIPYVSLRLLFKQPIKILSMRNIFYFTSFFLIILLSQLLRLDELNVENIMYVLSRFLSFGFAGLNAFDFWFLEYNFNFNNLQLGALTFEGFFDFIGFRDRVQGVFQEGVYLGDLPSTNIFTGYRILLMDFGLIGTILFLFFNGLIIFFSFDKIKTHKYHWIPLFTITISFYLWIFFASIYSSNTYLFGILISSIIIWLIKYLKFRF